jgi:hypothetical protein
MSPRLPRGTRQRPVRTGWVIAQDDKLQLERLAAISGVSAAAFLEQLINHVELDENDVPVWWPKQTNEELPINAD